MKKIFYLGLLWLSIFGLKSQEQLCGAHHKEAELWEQQPNLQSAYFNFRNQMVNANRTEDSVLTIPIVFHIIHAYGSENISDEQIYRQVEILNEDFRKLNSDTVNTVPEFQDIASDTRLEFRLAEIDPFGNCTNGITRSFSPEASIGDDYSKLNQWPRGRYLNVWVVRSMENGVAGYAYYPTSVEADNRFRDGVMIRHNYIGDIGTSNPVNSRALTHEIGHWLGLAHPWGPTNDPGLNSNCSTDDGIKDTPNTIGWTTCDLQGTTCNDSLDNVQNYMDYSYCSTMFTQGQVTYMRNAILSDVSQRSYLWSEDNHASVFHETPITCDPIADFYGSRVSCVGETVAFDNHSWRLKEGDVVYNWEFEDGIPSTSPAQNPSVTFTHPGWKKVTLSVTNNGLTHTIEKDSFIFVSPELAWYTGAQLFNFEDENGHGWKWYSEFEHERNWAHQYGIGKNGSKGMFLKLTSPYDNPVQFSPDYFYPNRLGGNKFNLISPPIDLSNSSNVSISFDFACATNTNNSDEMTEKLVVYVSRDCGASWQVRKTIEGVDLINNGSGWTDFIPNGQEIWTTESFSLADNFSGHLLLKFEYTASDLSNNIAIDNINVEGLLNTDNIAVNHFSVFPNPSTKEKGWIIVSNANEFHSGIDYQLVSIEGKKIQNGRLNSSGKTIIPTKDMKKGMYLLNVYNGTNRFIYKLILK